MRKLPPVVSLNPKIEIMYPKSAEHSCVAFM